MLFDSDCLSRSVHPEHTGRGKWAVVAHGKLLIWRPELRRRPTEIAGDLSWTIMSQSRFYI